jgi:hypothetical protein
MADFTQKSTVKSEERKLSSKIADLILRSTLSSRTFSTTIRGVAPPISQPV